MPITSFRRWQRKINTVERLYLQNEMQMLLFFLRRGIIHKLTGGFENL